VSSYVYSITSGKNSRLVSAAQAELLTGIEGISSRPTRRIVLRGG
jgi:hypothetical protein